jgi:hypothetical protein
MDISMMDLKTIEEVQPPSVTSMCSSWSVLKLNRPESITPAMKRFPLSSAPKLFLFPSMYSFILMILLSPISLSGPLGAL